jgi:hypothetical protein
MMSRRSKKPGNRVVSRSLDWRQFQARLQALLSVFYAAAAQGRARESSAAAAAKKPGRAEGHAVVQPGAHLPTILDQVGIKLDNQPTRAQLVSALAAVLDACKRTRTN